MLWKTKITELLGCKYPILEGAYGLQGGWKFAAAMANTGAYGLITATVAKTPEKLREHIHRCRDHTDGTFGVNLSLGFGGSKISEMLEVCVDERVPVETAVFRPDALAPRIKQAGLKWIHKTARIKDALHAERLGVDAIIVVGLEGTGFKSEQQMPTMMTTILAKRCLKVPFIAAGGIGDARGFLGALAMGADAVMLGTALMMTQEFPLSTRSKEAMAKAGPDNVELRNRVLNPPDPKELAEVMSLRGKVPTDQWLMMMEGVNLKKTDWRNPVDQHISSNQSIEQLEIVSLAAMLIDDIPTVKELIDRIISGAEELIDSYEFLKK